MQTKVFRHLWGYPITSEATFRTIRDDGYHGIESGLPAITDIADFAHCMKRYGLEFIGQVYTAEFSKGHSVDEHLASLQAEVEKLLPLDPIMVNIHSGEDTWSLDDIHRYFHKAIELEKAGSIPWAHETHRGRCLFHPSVACTLLRAHPDLKLVADFSHWVCVCERLLEDQGAAIALAAERTVHLHARVGFSQAPQVADPRSPQFAAERASFEAWWRLVFDAMRRRGLDAFSFCPEYGPAPYMPRLPFTDMPVADLDAICRWEADRVRDLARDWQLSPFAPRK